jgi:hypothetical protein
MHTWTLTFTALLSAICRHIVCRVALLQVRALTVSYSVRFGGMVFD